LKGDNTPQYMLPRKRSFQERSNWSKHIQTIKPSCSKLTGNAPGFWTAQCADVSRSLWPVTNITCTDFSTWLPMCSSGRHAHSWFKTKTYQEKSNYEMTCSSSPSHSSPATIENILQLMRKQEQEEEEKEKTNLEM